MADGITRTLICGACGKPFEFVRKPGAPARYCSAECRREMSRSQSLANYYAHTFEYSERARQWYHKNRERAKARPSESSRYRRARYAAKHHSGPTRQFVCVICGVSFKRPHGQGRPPTVCSPDCASERERRRAKRWYEANPERVAEQLGRSPERRSRVFREWYEANREREIQRAVEYARGPGREAKGARDAARRALKRGSPTAEKFTLDEIFERDGGVCHLCSKQVIRREATMDHLVPLTKGGSHTRVNVKLAHRGCNSRKGDRLVI
jgi:5-methylcytosine-specific restriction endonuclease McrA